MRANPRTRHLVARADDPWNPTPEEIAAAGATADDLALLKRYREISPVRCDELGEDDLSLFRHQVEERGRVWEDVYRRAQEMVRERNAPP